MIGFSEDLIRNLKVMTKYSTDEMKQAFGWRLRRQDVRYLVQLGRESGVPPYDDGGHALELDTRRLMAQYGVDKNIVSGRPRAGAP